MKPKNKVRLIKAKKKIEIISGSDAGWSGTGMSGGAGGSGGGSLPMQELCVCGKHDLDKIPAGHICIQKHKSPKKKVSKKELVCLVCGIPFIEGKGFIGKHKFPCANSRYGWSFVEEAKPTKKQILKREYQEAKRELVQATKDEYKAHKIYLKKKITFDIAEQKYRSCKSK